MANAAMVCLTDIHLLTSLCSALWVLQLAVLGLHGARGQLSLPVQYGTHTSKREKGMLRSVLNIQGQHYICHQVYWFDSWRQLGFRSPPFLSHNVFISN